MSNLVAVAVTVFVSLFVFFIFMFLHEERDRRRRKGLPYPPGPPSSLLTGNFFDIPKDKQPWIAYKDMSKIHGRNNILGTTGSPQLIRASLGDIFRLRTFSKDIVVLSSFSAIEDLLEKRGENYSDRPSIPIVKMYVV